MPPGELEAQVQKQVLLMWSGRPDLPANVLVNETIRSGLFREFGDDVDLRFEYVEQTQDPDAPRPALRDFLRSKYGGQRLDLVIAVATGAVRFVRQYGRELFPDVPLICWGTEDAIQDWGSGPPFTAVVGGIDAAATVEFILRLQPDTRRIAVIAGGSPFDNLANQAVARKAADAYAGRLTITHLVGRPLDELRKEVASLPPDTAILYAGVAGDTAGRRLLNVNVLASLAEAASVPMYGMVASNLGAGIVGGVVLSQEDVSTEAARLAVRVLRGARVEQLPVVHSASVPIADWRQLRRWRLPEDRLPAGTKVLYRQPSLWEAHKWRIVAIAAVCLLQAGMIGMLLVQRSRARRAAAELGRAEAALEGHRRELAHLGRVTMLGELSGTLAHELNQPLAAILINAETAKHFLERDPPNLAEAVKSLEGVVESDERASEIIKRMRRMLRRDEPQTQPLVLNEVVLEVLGLAQSDLLRQGVALSLELDPALRPVSGDRVQLQQVLLNLILNACDSMARTPEPQRLLRVSTVPEPQGGVELRVADRGPGIPSQDLERIFEPFVTSKPQGLGLGLSICRSIVEAHGGRIWASNAPDGGAVLHVVLPSAAATPAG